MLAVGHDEAVVAPTWSGRGGGRTHGRMSFPSEARARSASLGYVSAAPRNSSINFARWGIAPSRLYYASGSRGTQAGLTLGATAERARRTSCTGLRSAPASPRRSSARRTPPTTRPRCWALPTRVTHADLFTDQGFIGEGYGIPDAGRARGHRPAGAHRGHPAGSVSTPRRDSPPSSSTCVREKSRPPTPSSSCTPAGCRRCSRTSSRAAAARRSEVAARAPRDSSVRGKPMLRDERSIRTDGNRDIQTIAARQFGIVIDIDLADLIAAGAQSGFHLVAERAAGSCVEGDCFGGGHVRSEFCAVAQPM